MINMQGRVAIVFGIANKRSIAWAIAQKLQAAGATLAITYQNERLAQEAKDLIEALPGAASFQCDVSNDVEINQLFEQIKSRYGKLHTLVHSVAYAPPDELKNDFIFPWLEIGWPRGLRRSGNTDGKMVSLQPIDAMQHAVRVFDRLARRGHVEFVNVQVNRLRIHFPM